MSDLTPADLIAILCIYLYGSDLHASVAVSDRLEDLGLIDCIEDNGMTKEWAVTDGGKMLVESLCKAKIPVKRWVMP